MAEEGVPIGQRHVGHLPGEEVRVAIGFFRHEMNLQGVFAAFEHEEDHEPFEVTLRGRPDLRPSSLLMLRPAYSGVGGWRL